LKDASRRLNRLRRKIYRETPVATGSLGGDAALALWRAAAKKGFQAWCYEFGLPGSLTHRVTIIEADGTPRIHDAFFNLTYPLGFPEVLDALCDGKPVAAKTEIRDRKIYVMDPAFERETTIRWLEANATRELTPSDGLRRFEVLWNVEAFVATFAGIETVYQELEERGYPRDIRFLMLHPVEMFDGEKSYRDPATMPLLAGRDLASPLAASRSTALRASRELVSERRRGAEREAAIARLEGERDAAKSSLAAASAEARRLADRIVQLRAALDDETQRAATERQTLSQALAEARAQANSAGSEIAGLRTELTRVRAEWGAERNAWECGSASLQAAAGLWIEQSSAAAQTLRSERDAAQSETRQAVADRDRARAELEAQRHVLENSPWRRFRDFCLRALGRPRPESSAPIR
jgi:hypothetical protein